ncbi:hypothetical protein M513_07200 [Trichuris suis]|uniref:DDE-1 domain-containing protein n=1 Tax=Trichuris suis TaxID=68888 RepID=A0A085M3S5_9BILA|nr:hypothetical protein M513_07200 [Trichuris suis]
MLLTASQGWLDNFNKHHGIRSHDICGEKLSADEASADSFREELKKPLDEEGYDPDFVYNADETGLNWKALPSQSLVARHEENVPGYKARKERVTVMLCANSTGSHRLPLFLIGKAKKPRSFSGVKSLPVVYSHQKKAWMNVHLFQDWLKKLFISEVKWHLDYVATYKSTFQRPLFSADACRIGVSGYLFGKAEVGWLCFSELFPLQGAKADSALLQVKRYQGTIGKTGKVLLLIDNAPAHPVVNYSYHVSSLPKGHVL